MQRSIRSDCLQQDSGIESWVQVRYLYPEIMRIVREGFIKFVVSPSGSLFNRAYEVSDDVGKGGGQLTDLCY